MPISFVALTRKSYDVPGLKPMTSIVVALPVGSCEKAFQLSSAGSALCRLYSTTWSVTGSPLSVSFQKSVTLVVVVPTDSRSVDWPGVSGGVGGEGGAGGVGVEGPEAIEGGGTESSNEGAHSLVVKFCSVPSVVPAEFVAYASK